MLLGYYRVLFTDYTDALFYSCSAVAADGSCLAAHESLLVLSRSPRVPADGSILWIIIASNVTSCVDVQDVVPLLNDGVCSVERMFALKMLSMFFFGLPVCIRGL